MTINFVGKDFESTKNKKIPCEENGRKYTAINDAEKDILKIHVDGDLITSAAEKRCDYALNVWGENKLYLIELKGCDKAHAFEQILATIVFFNSKTTGCCYYPRIILSKDSAPNIQSTAEKQIAKMVKQGKCMQYIKKTRCFEESI